MTMIAATSYTKVTQIYAHQDAQSSFSVYACWSNCQCFLWDKKLPEKAVINSLDLGNSWAERLQKTPWWRIYCVFNGPHSQSVTRKSLKRDFFDLYCILINQKSWAHYKASSCPRRKKLSRAYLSLKEKYLISAWQQLRCPEAPPSSLAPSRETSDFTG